MKLLKIGQVAAKSGFKIDTLRYYERIGLLDQPSRTASGYRQYMPDVVTRLRFIQRARGLGFSLRETKELLDLRVSQGAQAEVREIAAARLTQIEAKLAELEGIRRALEEITSACTGRGSTSDCPILAALESNANSQIAEGGAS